MYRLTLSTLVLVCGAGVTLGQYAGGVNIDFNVAAGAGAGQPTILFGGAVGQPGYWNPINPPLTSGASIAVRDLGNSINAVNLTLNWAGSPTRNSVNFNNSNTTGDTELLMDDVLDLGSPASGAHTFTLGVFAPGIYRVATFACAPDNAAFRTSVVTSGGGFSPGPTAVGGAIPAGGSLVEGVTHATHTVALLAPGSITVTATPTVSFGTLNGMQVQRLAATRLYVREGGTGTGLSWADALGSIKSALILADAMPTVQEVWVAQGRYYTDETLGGDRDATFTLRSGLSLVGGFQGTEITIADRGDPRYFANWTILDGSMNTYNDPSDDALQIVTVNSATGVTIDGMFFLQGRHGARLVGSTVTLTNCYFSNSGDSAVRSALSTVTMRDSTWVGCRGNGTALFASGSGSVSMDRCTIYNGNSTSSCAGVARVEVPLVVSNSLIHGNRSSCGGQFEVFGGGQLEMYNCTLAGNTGNNSTGNVGLLLLSGSNVIRNSILWGNRSPGNAASLQGQQLIVEAPASLSITDSIVEGWDGSLGDVVLANNGLDPLFVDPNGPNNIAGDADDNYRLRPFSPARDSAWWGGTPLASRLLDVLGNPRVVDDTLVANTGYLSAGNPMDRGCYEMQSDSEACPGDIGQTGGVEGPDGRRDNNDFVVFISWFFASDPRADIGRTGGVGPGDGIFNNNDFIVFIDRFFTPCP